MQFDKDYLKQREKQIHEMYELRAMTVAVTISALLLGLGSIMAFALGSQTLGTILFVVTLLFGLGAIFMVADYMAKKGADQAFQEELAIYGQMMEKPKREPALRLSDDGELVAASDEDDQPAAAKRS
jgi:hypothetical protein